MRSDQVSGAKQGRAAFLRWAGGKRQLLPHLLDLIPRGAWTVYREPFLGAGSLFFALRPNEAVLSDANGHLIRCYEFVRDQPAAIGRHLRIHVARNCETYYYRIRDTYNQSRFSSAQAARFIYLNKACFNGIFRVNRRGKFNVPYGRKEPPSIPTTELLATVSEALKRASLKVMDFEDALDQAESGDFVYLDPPYPPLNGTAYFAHYTADRFSARDQEKLAAQFRELDKRGCLILMSNADTPLIRRLYRPYKSLSLQVTRFLTCKKKHRVGELIITNYEC